MLTTTMELWPFGYEDAAKSLLTINIANLGLGGAGYDYIYTIDEPDPLYNKEPISTWGLLTDFDRKAYAIDILREVLNDYHFRSGPPQMKPFYEDMVQRLRDKTLKSP